MHDLRKGQILLTDQVYVTLKQRIVEGVMSPGSQISEGELADELNVSRSPLRAALSQLAKEGLVEVYPQFGRFVAPISLDAVEQAQFIREHLECALIRDVITHLDENGRKALTDNIDRQQYAFKTGKLDQFYELDEALHSLFAHIAKREIVGDIIRQQKVHLDRIRRLSLPLTDQVPKLIEQHTSIVDAILQGNEKRAEGALRIHLREIFEVIKNLGLENDAEARLRRRRPSPASKA